MRSLAAILLPLLLAAVGNAAEPHYLIFQLGTESGDFERFFPEVQAEFRAAPAGSLRQVGFGLALFTLKTPIEDLRRQVTHALDISEKSGLPVLFKLDDVNFNLEYTDPSMVEWTAFPKPGEVHGPPAKYYWLNWGTWVALPPPPNFESPAFRREVKKRLEEGVLPPLLERLARWKQQNRSYLFAGIVLGWETGIPEYRPLRQSPVLPRDERRQITMSKEELGEQLGYASLYAKGWTQQKIRDAARQSGKSEEDVTTEALFQVIHDYSAFWTKTVHDAGIPKERIYTHGVAWESVPDAQLPAPWFRKSSRIPPIWAHVNNNSRPGYTSGAGQFEPGALVKLLRAAGASDGWGAVEAYVRDVESQEAFGGYLRQLFDSGAHMVDIFGWTAPGSPYDPKRAPGALRAVHAWLEGKELPRATGLTTRATPPQALHQKVIRLQSLVQKHQQEGSDMQPLRDLMQGFEPLMRQQKFNEAEALVDRALGLMGDAAPAETPLIAFGARDTDGRQQIFVIKLDGTGKRRLTQEGKQNFFPVWSPDGNRLAFTSDRNGSAQVWVMDADGGNQKQLTREGGNIVPAWSPDGKRLAFGSNRTGHFEIWVMDSDGKNQKQLTRTDAKVNNNAASWSPDGRRIAFCSTRSGHYAIWAMDSEGGHLTQLTTPYGDRAIRMPICPYGRRTERGSHSGLDWSTGTGISG